MIDRWTTPKLTCLHVGTNDARKSPQLSEGTQFNSNGDPVTSQGPVS